MGLKQIRSNVSGDDNEKNFYDIHCYVDSKQMGLIPTFKCEKRKKKTQNSFEMF